MDKKKMPQIPAASIMDEIRKVTWPSRAETIRLTSVVIIICLIIGMYIGIIDVLLTKGLDFVTKMR